jgi:SAM-dependent MidA family methyltransferase
VSEEEGSELASFISGLINDKGPITFADFMEQALYHPELGYYRTDREVWGAAGDYITNADAAAVFTKLIAKQICEAWRALGSPEDFTLIEAGGGRGLTLKGILDSLKEFHPDLFEVVKVVMVERSDNHGFDSLDGKPVDWYNDIKSVGALENAVIFTNELLDALPFHRVVGDSGGLKELYVGIDPESGGGFVDIIGEPSTEALNGYFASLGIELAEGQQAEASLNAVDWILEAGALFKRGFVVTIDYGLPASELYSPERQGTLLCHYRHTINDDPYRSVGLQDITAHVDFTSVVRAGLETGLKPTGFTNQLSFLMGLGIAEELHPVSDDAAESFKAIAHNQTIKELIMPGGTGENFKVLVQHKGIEAPALKGFSFRDRKNLLQGGISI